MILLVDNYDSFVFNLARYLRELGETVEVVRNDALDVARARALRPSHLVVSPGPCTPTEAGASLDLIRALSADTPILGVCLGHQAIAAAFGGRIRRAARPAHGVVSTIGHGGDGLFTGLPSPLPVARYHSLVADPASLPHELRVTARTGEGEVMALAHATLRVWGVQFHPEAVMTAGGHRLLSNFLALGRGLDPAGGPDGSALPAELPAPTTGPGAATTGLTALPLI